MDELINLFERMLSFSEEDMGRPKFWFCLSVIGGAILLRWGLQKGNEFETLKKDILFVLNEYVAPIISSGSANVATQRDEAQRKLGEVISHLQGFEQHRFYCRYLGLRGFPMEEARKNLIGLSNVIVRGDDRYMYLSLYYRHRVQEALNFRKDLDDETAQNCLRMFDGR